MQTEQLQTAPQIEATAPVASDSAAALAAIGGIQLADYQLTDRLGAGGYGEVWKAIGPGGLPKAVKVLYGQRDGAYAEAELKALERMRDLRHPFLLSIERIEVANARLIVVTELADCNLSERFEACRREGLPGIPRDELLGYLRDAADALDFMAVKHGLQHLDIKPDNILIQGDHAKVGDFGLAKDLNATNVSILNGFTPTFAAPELFEGQPGQASDQYSLAIVYQYMLTGALPFNGRTAAQLTAQHLSSQPDLSALQPVDRPVIARALAKNMRSRFDSCRNMIDELARRNHSRTGPKFNAIVSPPASQRSDLQETSGDTQELSQEESQPVAITPEPAEGRALRRTAFVGIGGLGGAVLNRLRPLLRSSTTQSDAFPMLYIDSDRSALVSGDAFSSLLPEEKIEIPLRSSKEYRAARNVDLSWMSRRWLFNIPRSMQVEGIRPLGRLALFDHRQTVTERLQHVLASVHAGADGNTESADDGVDVYVVAGTSGGTGSGAVADVGLIIRKLAEKASCRNVRVFGVLLHGTGSNGNLADVQEANTVCLLRELAHLTTPGLGTPRGFDNVRDDVRPFDDTWLVHVGDGLNQSRFDAAAANVASWLFNASATDAAFDFEAWRENATEEMPRSLRLLGISSQNASSFQAASSEAGSLCRLLLNSWAGTSATGTQSETVLPVQTSDTTALLDELKLTETTLPPQIRALLTGNLGGEIQKYSEFVFQTVAASTDVTSCSQADLLTSVARSVGTATPTGDGTKSLTQIISSLKGSLSQVTSKCQNALQSHVAALLDGPQRLRGATAAADRVLSAVSRSVETCGVLLKEIESAFTSMSGAPSDSSASGGGGYANMQAASAACREYCCLVGYQMVYQLFIGHLSEVRDSAQTLCDRLAALTQQFQAVARELGSDRSEAEAVPGPVVDALDRHVRSLHPALLRDLISGDTENSVPVRKLLQAASQFLTAAAGSHASSNGGVGSGEFPKDVWPRLRGCGGQRRVLGIVPQGVDAAELETTLRNEFDDCVATRNVKAPYLTAVCEIDGVEYERILKHMIRSNPHIADVAGRIHVRNDIDW